MIYCDSNETSIFKWILDFSNSVVFFVFILVKLNVDFKTFDSIEVEKQRYQHTALNDQPF
jgi:hypothetical protein